MINIKETLREALILRDWELVINCYRSLNEETCTTIKENEESVIETPILIEEIPQEPVQTVKPKRGRGRPKKVKTPEPKIWTANEEPEDFGQPIELGFDPSKVRPRRSSEEKHFNAFIDSGRSYQEDKEFDSKNKHIRTPRRDPESLIDVTCDICKRTVSVSRKLAPPFIEGSKERHSFRCNRCYKG